MKKLVIEHDKAQLLLDYLVTKPFVEVFGFVKMIQTLAELKEAETTPTNVKELKAHGDK